MRVAFILNSAGLYGANRSLLSLIRYLVFHEVKCFVVIPDHGVIEQELEKSHIEYTIAEYRSCVWYPGYIGLPFLVNLINIPTIMKTIRNWDVDIIHSNSSNIDIGIIIAKLLRKKHVWHVREIMELFYDAKYIFPRLYKKLRYNSDAVICVSKYTYNYHMHNFPNPNMHMIYNPYDVEYYNISRTDFAPKDKITILVAGLFGGKKRQIDSVKAVKILVEKGIRQVRLILAGGGEQSRIDEINEYITANNLEEYVIVKNFVDDLRKIRAEADISLCCSEGEALPRVVVEGMLGELLSIGVDSGGVSELIEDGVTGLLYDVGDCEQLADKIEYAILHKQKCREMIVRAKKYAVDNFELNQSGAKVLNLYNELLNLS